MIFASNYPIGIILTDLTFVNDGNPDYGHWGFFNLAKRRKQYEILKQVSRFKEKGFVFLPVAALQDYIKTIQPLSEDERYSLAIALSTKSA